MYVKAAVKSRKFINRQHIVNLNFWNFAKKSPRRVSDDNDEKSRYT